MTVEATPTTARRVVALAVPALVVLAAEPLYVLVDTAVVGHLGRVQLGALAIGGGMLTAVTWLGTTLTWATTSRSARLYGAGRRADAVAEGVQASWLGLGLGLLLAVLAQLLAGPVSRALAGGGPEAAAIAEGAEQWLRVASLGAPAILLTLAGNGWMRGVQETRRPIRYVLGPNLLSALLCPLLVYGADLGLVGSAIANVVAQVVSAALFVGALLAERAALRPVPAVLRAQLGIAKDLLVRVASLQACFLSASAVAARFGAPALGAHQIAVQLYFFCALALDALAVAAQSLIGADLGADRGEAARQTARRVTVMGAVAGLAFGAVLAAGAVAIPALFTDDPATRAQALVAWPWLAAVQPVAGAVFALDGVLVGAGDVTYMRNLTLVATIGAFLPATWLAYALDLGLGGVWAGLTLFVVVRFVALGARLFSGKWVVVGANR